MNRAIALSVSMPKQDGESTRRTALAISFLWVTTALAAACQFATQWILAHKLGPAAFGAFSSALATVNILSPLAGFGAYRLLLKKFGEEGWAAMRWMKGALACVGISSCAITLLIVSYGLVDGEAMSRSAILILAPIVLGQATLDVVSAKYQLEERFRAVAIWQTAQPLGRLALMASALLAMGHSFTAANAAYCYSIVALLIVGVGLIQARRLATGNFALAGHNALRAYRAAQSSGLNISQVAIYSWPFCIDAMFFLLYLQGGIIILEKLATSSSAGIYSVALSMVMATYLLPGVVYQKFLAVKLNRWMSQDRPRLRKAHRVGWRLMLAAGLVGMIAIWSVGPEVVIHVLGKKYEAIRVPLAILAVCIPLKYTSSGYGALMVAGDLIVKKVAVVGAAAVANIFFALLLVPNWGAAGAAWSSVIAEVVVLAGSVWLVRRGNLITGPTH